MFKLQGYSSWLFNKYLEQRIKIYVGINLLDGDLLLDDKATNGYILYKKPNIYQTIASWKEKGFFVEATPREIVPVTTSTINQITGPLIGYNTLMNPADTEAGKYE